MDSSHKKRITGPKACPGLESLAKGWLAWLDGESKGGVTRGSQVVSQWGLGVTTQSPQEQGEASATAEVAAGYQGEIWFAGRAQ